MRKRLRNASTYDLVERSKNQRHLSDGRVAARAQQIRELAHAQTAPRRELGSSNFGFNQSVLDRELKIDNEIFLRNDAVFLTQLMCHIFLFRICHRRMKWSPLLGRNMLTSLALDFSKVKKCDQLS